LERLPDVGEGSGKGFTTGGRVCEKGFGARKPAQKGFTGGKKLIAGDARLLLEDDPVLLVLAADSSNRLILIANLQYLCTDEAAVSD
jgi:hypothetical protein